MTSAPHALAVIASVGTTVARLALAGIFFVLAAYWLGLARRAEWAVRRQPTPGRFPPLPLALLALFLGLLNLLVALT